MPLWQCCRRWTCLSGSSLLYQLQAAWRRCDCHECPSTCKAGEGLSATVSLSLNCHSLRHLLKVSWRIFPVEKRLVENPLRALDGFMRLNWRAFMVDFLKLSWLLHLQVWSSPKRSNQWMAMVSSVYRQSQVELRKTPTGRCCCLMMSVQFKYLIIYVCLIAFYHSKTVSTWNDVIEPNQHMGGWIFCEGFTNKKATNSEIPTTPWCPPSSGHPEYPNSFQDIVDITFLLRLSQGITISQSFKEIAWCDIGSMAALREFQ